MELEQSFIALIEQSIKTNWYLNALTDYKGITLQYRDVARKIEKIHILLENAGIEKGDKIAICGRNSAHWTVTYLAVITYGAVVVPILHEFKADQVHNIVNHSEARLLFVGDQIWENLNEVAMPHLEGIIELKDFGVPVSRSEKLAYARDHLNEIFGHKFPCRFRPDDISYEKEKSEDLAIINYTSGTTGYSKGVMLPYRSILSNVLYCKEKIGLKAGDSVVSMLPLGHVFGMTFDFLYGFTAGAHLWFLTRMPSPKIIAESFAEIRPRVIACVPLIVEKIFKKNILPKVDNKLGKLLLHVPIISDKIKELIKQKAMEVFGGNFIEIIIGGAPFNAEVEAFLKMIDFPYTIAYGMTECGPIICHSHWTELKLASCGKVAARMEAKVLSPNPSAIAGELVCRGANLMLGYYKNEEATRQVIDTEGWLHTGDMATIDEDGNVFIKGRCKNLLLTSSGQNIYPEEIESKLNNMPYVSESLIILQQDKLVGLIYPDSDDAFAHGLSQSDLVRVMEENRLELNKQLPAFSQIARFKLYPEEFEKTAKKSIKRFLYQDIKE
ncbi:AMP-binding protein [Phocaeicola vulgatus]|jgi:long-chain acyl-CoA synthetase|uniref:AMP-binding protein n=1 Tax=Phocaeicola vulgatus TaxID=821 RepID=A0A6I0I1U6_PHOVU|nr:long-chain fatty acid--CoA ligase [Phocaeicola vulgatus]CDF18571.1 putative long-chain-fatty-acid-CoA ligase [Phocaeicola vulgatus CAG:6]KAB3852547.1 AMP-binding protein [Phocaeicola vulgatus]KAB3853516.1 AMP-binding protein [Phocaeicola vulgatus]KAB3864771.1 AMP-binding protein [Phocaeicola vulgatus]KAB3865675.1 AMP-binding protein [Phocaeicola vulgatus]